MPRQTVTIFHGIAASPTWQEFIQLPFNPTRVSLKALTYSSGDNVLVGSVEGIRASFIPFGTIFGTYLHPTTQSNPDTDFQCIDSMQGNITFEALNLAGGGVGITPSAGTGMLSLTLEFSAPEPQPAPIVHPVTQALPPFNTQLEIDTLAKVSAPNSIQPSLAEEEQKFDLSA